MAEIIEIKSVDAPELDPLIRLTDRQLKRGMADCGSTFAVESPIAIEAALESGLEPVMLLTETKFIDGRMKKIAAELEKLENVKIFTAEREILTGITGFDVTRGSVCLMRRPAPSDWREVVRSARRIAILENIVDTTNMGAIFRSAAGLGIGAVLLSPECCDPLCRRAVRVSMGTVLKIPFARIGEKPADWPQPAMTELKVAGFKTAALALSGNDTDITDPALKNAEKLALILGNEGSGLLSETVKNADYTVRIPMHAGVDSLNVAAAAAIAFFELAR